MFETDSKNCYNYFFFEKYYCHGKNRCDKSPCVVELKLIHYLDFRYIVYLKNEHGKQFHPSINKIGGTNKIDPLTKNKVMKILENVK